MDAVRYQQRKVERLEPLLEEALRDHPSQRVAIRLLQTYLREMDKLGKITMGMVRTWAKEKYVLEAKRIRQQGAQNQEMFHDLSILGVGLSGITPVSFEDQGIDIRTLDHTEYLLSQNGKLRRILRLKNASFSIHREEITPGETQEFFCGLKDREGEIIETTLCSIGVPGAEQDELFSWIIDDFDINYNEASFFWRKFINEGLEKALECYDYGKILAHSLM